MSFGGGCAKLLLSEMMFQSGNWKIVKGVIRMEMFELVVLEQVGSAPRSLGPSKVGSAQT